MGNSKRLSSKQQEDLLKVLKDRFGKNISRHNGIEWVGIQAKQKANTEKLWSLYEMERTGGEPDVVGKDKNTGEFVYYNCSAESPKGRRRLCYESVALESRKEYKPENTAIDMATEMGIELLTEEQYRELFQHGIFDIKTSRWVVTPAAIRSYGGAIFAIVDITMCLYIKTVPNRIMR